MNKNPGLLLFGKYRGFHVSSPEIPTEYLEWLLSAQETLIAQLKDELSRRERAAEENQSWAARIVQAGFRELAKRHHPDQGGKSEDMRDLIAANEQLKASLERKPAASAGYYCSYCEAAIAQEPFWTCGDCGAKCCSRACARQHQIRQHRRKSA